MLASRVILHMRESAKQPTLEWVGGEYSSGRLEFADPNTSVGTNMHLPSDQLASFRMKEFSWFYIWLECFSVYYSIRYIIT